MANNICYRLGYQGGTSYTLPKGKLPYVKEIKRCNGNERNILDCNIGGETGAIGKIIGNVHIYD